MAEKEYIEREAAIELLSEPVTMSMCLSTEECHHKIAQQRIDRYLIENIPSADVRPVVRGHIEEDENTYLYCSECNCNITLAAYQTPNGNLILRPNFCPNCGADMREER